jgi:cystathionine gamma-synthase/methionine-gamma-lyase
VSAFNAWLLMRSMVTLPMRMQRHCENGLAIARFLEAHPQVKFVRYPGLESHPQHAVARRQMTGFGGMLNFALRGPKQNYFTFLSRLKIITHAVCLGHAESLVQFYPQEGDHPELGVLNYPENIGEGFLRLSVGLEDVEDLIADLSQALGHLE